MRQPPLDLTVRVGCHVVWQAPAPVAMVLVLRPATGIYQRVLHQTLTFSPLLSSYAFTDANGNSADRVIMQPGQNVIHHDAMVQVPAQPDNFEPVGQQGTIYQLPFDVLRYTLPSRYCDSDKLMDFAWQLFGPHPERGRTGPSHLRLDA